jgi:lysozyme family protein
MASYEVAFDWMMESEDPEQSCAVVPDAPVGAHAISGINSAAFPYDFKRISAMPQEFRLPAVSEFYETHFWNQWFAQLTSDDLAKRVFDASVNMGSVTAVKILQSVLWPSQEHDGTWGPITLQGANEGNPTATVEGFKNARRQHYLDIVKANTEDAKYLNVWLARASK